MRSQAVAGQRHDRLDHRDLGADLAVHRRRVRPLLRRDRPDRARGHRGGPDRRRRDLRIIASIVWPGVRGTTIAIAILSAIGSLKTFDIPFLITGGGPSYATEFLGTLIYRVSVSFSQVGYGAAISIVLLVLRSAPRSSSTPADGEGAPDV